MFGGAKPTFGSAAGTTGFGGFNTTATASPFAQSAFGKPTTTAFGAAPAFGTQQAQPSLFGVSATQPQGTSLFGGPSTSTAFGTTTTAQSAFGAFSQPQQNTSIFGTAQNTTASTSLFGQSGTSAFGSAAKPGGIGTFGQAATAQPATSLFGQQAAPTSTSAFGSFGQAAPTTTNVFGSGATSAFGQPQPSVGAAGNIGTSLVKYQATIGTDTLMKGGQANNVNTKQHCITAMKEYESKSLEELRMEDYLAKRMGPQAGTSAAAGFFGSVTAGGQPGGTTTSLFGATTQPAGGLFGQPATGAPENKSLFGQSAFGTPGATSAFGAPTQQQNNFLAKPFGNTGTSAFGTTATDAANPFGQAKPAFGQTAAPSLFGQTPATSAAPAFGQPTTGFSGFGVTAGQQQASMFATGAATDPNKPAFGIGGAAPTANTGFSGFGAPATSTASGGLFGVKPATGFGATPAFGVTSTANTGFANFSLTNTNNAGGGLFNTSLNKPATTGFGAFGTQPSVAPLNFNTGNTGGFGTPTAKPGISFIGSSNMLGNSTSTAGGGGLFTGGGASAFGTNTALGGAFGTLGGNTTLSGGFAGTPLQQQTVPIHQQILAKVTSPYGDTSIFKDLKRNDETDASRATNPVAQQTILDTSNNTNHFKLVGKPSPSAVKSKQLGGGITKKALFEGLEEFDASVENFCLKPNAKRLVLNPKTSSSSNIISQTSLSSGSNSMASGATSAGTVGSANSVTGSSLSPSAVRQPLTAITNSERSKEPFSGEVSTAKPDDPVSSSSEKEIIETTRRESWLHPNNLEKVRQRNLNAGIDSGSPLNSTLTELVPRKPLDTYRPPSASSARLSVSTIPENSFEDQANRRTTSADQSLSESIFQNRSYLGDDRSIVESDEVAEYEVHPTGITLRRVGYYTIPTLDELKSYLAEDGSCIVPNFTVGREGYGNVYFGRELDVAGLNLDEIVHFRNKEIIIYPDDDNKPPTGSGLNREAQVTLDQVWPYDKTKHEPIKDPQRLATMDWEGKLRRVCDKNDTRFIEYRSETGSWVFRVKHFSKYGLNDSDEEDVLPTDPKKAKMIETNAIGKGGVVGKSPPTTSSVAKMTLSALKNAQKISEEAARSLDPKSLAAASSIYVMDDPTDYMLMDKTQFFEHNSNDLTMYAPTKSLGSPTTSLAKDIGNDSHKLQLMKASFFIEDGVDYKSVASDVENFSAENQNRNTGQNFLERDLYQPTQNMWKDAGKDVGSSEASSHYDMGFASPAQLASSAASVISALHDPNTESSSPAPESVSTAVGPTLQRAAPYFVMRPKIAPVRSLARALSFSKSIAQQTKNHWVADLGLYNSRHFKLGFGPQNTLIVPTTYNNITTNINRRSMDDVSSQIFKSRANDDYSATILQHLKIASLKHYGNLHETLVPHLEIELKNCCVNEVEDTECPWLQTSPGSELIIKHLEEAIKQPSNVDELSEYTTSVWSLLLALWGEHEELEGRDSTSHFTVMCRRNFLSEWLENTLCQQDLSTCTVSKHTYLEHLLNLVMSHKVTEACELAFNYDDANMALLLSQLSSGPVLRQLVEDQLAAWHMDKSDKFISLERLKLYMLVAGVSLMSSSHGPINTLEDIEWLRALALQLWYLTPATSSITDALCAYEKSFTSEEFYSAPPSPHYFNDANYIGKRDFYDLRYHLLRLYSKRSHPLERLLNPATHTTDPMDFRLSWLVLQTVEALGYHHCSELNESQIHVGFGSQLENNGLWEWAVFVLLHIKNRNQRELAVQQLLYRYVKISIDCTLTEKEQFLVNRLGVPKRWINYAKSVKAGASGQYDLQTKYLIKAKQWTLAHELIFKKIAPDAIIDERLNYLHSFLNQFECFSDANTNDAKVPNWSICGQIFLDFIELNKKFKEIQTLDNQADIEAHWENLKPQLSDLCSRINLLPCPTMKHRLCQSEIASAISNLIRGVLVVCPEFNACMIIKIALERLPLPQEFSQQELRTLLDALIEDIVKIMDKKRMVMLPIRMQIPAI